MLPPTIQNVSTSPSALAVDRSRSPSSPVPPAAAKPHTSAHRARVVGERRRHAADFGAALHAGVAADRHQPAAGPRRQAAREPEVDERPHGVDAVSVLRQAHRPDEDRLRSLDQQTREGLDAGPRHAALGLDRVPAAYLRPGRSTSAAPVVCASTNARSMPPCARQRLQHADEEREIAAGVDVEPVVGDRRAGDRARGRSRGSSSGPARARDTG